MRRPKWAQWQADNPPSGVDPEANRRFWYFMAWDVRFWLVFGASLVLFAIVLLIAVVAEAVF
jgi:hypothetical protein